MAFSGGSLFASILFARLLRQRYYKADSVECASGVGRAGDDLSDRWDSTRVFVS